VPTRTEREMGHGEGAVKNRAIMLIGNSTMENRKASGDGGELAEGHRQSYLDGKVRWMGGRCKRISVS